MTLSREEAIEHADDTPSNPTRNETFEAINVRRVSRRGVLKGAMMAGTALAVGGAAGMLSRPAEAAGHGGSFHFEEISHGVDETHHVAKGYDADVLIRWGDPVFTDSPEFDPMNQTPEAQAMQFGYNNDFLGLHPLSDSRAVLCVNHEYTNEEVMFPGIGRQDKDGFPNMTEALVRTEMAAHGGTLIEITRGADGKWSTDTSGKLNRRITAHTPMRISGPAAGNSRMKTSDDPSGTAVLGTINNCAGGMTPWGTYLMAEENFNGYFWGKDGVDAHPETDALNRYGAPGEWYAWGQYEDRFDVTKEPNEVNRFGWVVEVDVLDPTSTPVKRTALGRFKHEGAENLINGDGRVVVYMGDDQRFDYLYKFVSANAYDPTDRAANMNLLDEGTLYVAKFDDDGGLTWMPLVHGQGPLTEANGFRDQGDVLISTRQASDLLGATKMDRPEDVEANPKTGKIYVMLTNNSRRKPEDVDGPNPRAENRFGQIVEITEDGGDNAAETAKWELLVVCGDPNNEEVGAMWNPATTENGWFASPDNCAVDPEGRLWISTDQGSGWSRSGTADGIWGLETENDLRGTGKIFFRVPIGAEMCGPRFTEDGTALFVAVQHPATDGTKNYPGFERDSTFEDPATRWPDFQDGVPPHPSVVVITKQGGGRIG